MRMASAVLARVLAANPMCALAAEGALQAGAYEVVTRLELPHLEEQAVAKTKTVGLTGGPGPGLAVLSDDNPLAGCPIANLRLSGAILAFDIICEGVNQGSATARFAHGDDRFTGAIRMKMGGKNMTMTERQSGARSYRSWRAQVRRLRWPA